MIVVETAPGSGRKIIPCHVGRADVDATIGHDVLRVIHSGVAGKFPTTAGDAIPARGRGPRRRPFARRSTEARSGRRCAPICSPEAAHTPCASTWPRAVRRQARAGNRFPVRRQPNQTDVVAIIVNFDIESHAFPPSQFLSSGAHRSNDRCDARHRANASDTRLPFRPPWRLATSGKHSFGERGAYYGKRDGVGR